MSDKAFAAPAAVATARHGAEPIARTPDHQPPQATQVDRIASAASSIAGAGAAGVARAPSLIGARPVQVGDLVVGKHIRHAVPVFNLDQTNEATLEVRVVGAPALRVLSAPDRLRPSHEGFDASRQVVLEFRPTTQGRLTASLEIVMWWPNGGRDPETVRVPIVGGAHDPMGPTLDEQDTARSADADVARKAAKHAAEQTAISESIAAEEKRDTHFHEGDKRRLGNARQLAQIALNGVYQSRRNGIDSARAAIGEFKRIQPKANKTLLEELAWMALDTASAGIAGGISKRLEPVLKRILSTTEVIPFPMVNGQFSIHSLEEVPGGAGIVGLITDGIKHLVKSGGKAGSNSLAGGDGEHDGPSLSTDAREDFLLAHQESLVTATMEQAGDVTIRAHDALLPTLKSDPEKAVEAMNAIATNLQHEQTAAMRVQSHETLLHWVRYVAQNSLGSIETLNKRTGKIEPVTAIERANEKREGDQPLRRQDGLLDVTFTADFQHPERPVVTKGARLTGVRRGVADHLMGQPMKSLGLPVRASGLLGGPSVSVTVVRDERGAVTYTDNTTVEWQQATWLARKAGVVTNGTPSDELRGARILIENDIMTRELGKLETDSET